MMSGDMASAMGWMTVIGWLTALVVVVLLVAAIVALVRLLSPDIGVATGSGLKILLVVLATMGVLAVLATLSAFFMHSGMRGMMG